MIAKARLLCPIQGKRISDGLIADFSKGRFYKVERGTIDHHFFIVYDDCKYEVHADSSRVLSFEDTSITESDEVNKNVVYNKGKGILEYEPCPDMKPIGRRYLLI